MMDRSALIRYANDTLLDEFQQRIIIQTRHIETQMAMLRKELSNLQAELDHLNKFFPQQQEPQEKLPKTNSQGPEVKIPDFLAQGPATGPL